jgi:hypothetical protein
MTRWTASVVAILLTSFPSVASAQVNCDAIPHGPARTDCYLGLSQFYRAQSDLAAARARVQSTAAWYCAITEHVLQNINRIIETKRLAGWFMQTWIFQGNPDDFDIERLSCLQAFTGVLALNAIRVRNIARRPGLSLAQSGTSQSRCWHHR